MTYHVDVIILKNALEYIAAINNVPLKDIVWEGANMVPYKPTEEILKEWKFIGLSNVCFAKEYVIRE